MYQKHCRCALADRFYGGGGSGGSINVPSLGSEIGQVTKGFQSNVLPSFNNFVQGQPLLQNLTQFGLQAGQAIEPYLLSVIGNQGGLTQQEMRSSDQQTRAAFQARGNLFGNQAIGSEVLNRDEYKWRKLQQALGLAGTTEQLLGYPEQQATGNYATLANPLYGLAAAQLGAQTQAQIAQAEAASQGKSGTSGLIGSGIGAIGSIAGAAL
jgi:hypothetical protein